jgi:hypothetical protein
MERFASPFWSPVPFLVPEKVIKDLPREPEVVELFKKLFGADPLPPRLVGGFESRIAPLSIALSVWVSAVEPVDEAVFVEFANEA